MNRGYPHPLLPFDRGWPPLSLIAECGYPHLLLCLDNDWPPPLFNVERVATPIHFSLLREDGHLIDLSQGVAVPIYFYV